MKRLFSKLSIFKQILSLSLILFLLTAIIILLNYSASDALSERDDVKNMEFNLLKAMDFQTRFINEREMSDADSTIYWIKQIFDISDKYYNDPEISVVVKFTNSYHDTLKMLFSNTSLRGLDENSGAEGALRNSVHEIEAIIKEADKKDLLIDMLSARRSEKDFFLRKEDKYIDRVKKAVLSLKQNTANSDLSYELKEKILELAKNYEFKFIYATDLIKVNKRILSSLNNLADKIQNVLSLRLAEKETKASILRNVSYAFLPVALLLGIVLSIAISNLITTPITKLINMSRSIAEGRYDTRAKVIAENEIGVLAGSLNTMVDKINQTQAELVKEKESVERKIDKALEESEARKVSRIKSVEEILNKMEKFADGDLTVSLHGNSSFDLEKLYDGFNGSVQKMNRIILGLQNAALATIESSERINSGAYQIAELAESQFVKVQNVAVAVDEITSRIGDASQNAVIAVDAAEKAGKTAASGGEVIKETIAGIDKISEVVEYAVGNVQKLSDSGIKINEIVQVITDIADQTNLLALNAAIEAARAGDHGRGFAVVADEVKKLSNKTVEATVRIREMITVITNDTDETIRAIRNGSEMVRDGKSQADKAAHTLREIIESNSEVIGKINMMAEVIQSQSDSAIRINENIDIITTEAKQSAKEIAEVAKIAYELKNFSDDLKHELHKFKVNSNSALIGKPEDRLLMS